MQIKPGQSFASQSNPTPPSFPSSSNSSANFTSNGFNPSSSKPSAPPPTQTPSNSMPLTSASASASGKNPLTPLIPTSIGMQKILDITKGFEERIPTVQSVAERYKSFKPTVDSLSQADKTKYLQQFEKETAGCSEHLMRELLKLDEFPYADDAEKKFKKDRITQIQSQIHVSDEILHEVQRLENQYGINHLSMKMYQS